MLVLENLLDPLVHRDASAERKYTLELIHALTVAEERGKKKKTNITNGDEIV